jgi:hypothetical protein
LFLGTCNETSDTTFVCLCEPGWNGTNCETIDNYCKNNKCENNGVCRPLLRDYKCECLGESFSGQYCEITAIKIKIYRIVSKSFSYVGIIALIIVAMFIVIMDILKYCFGIDPVEGERERIRRKKQATKRKPVIQRFVYVNAPVSSPPEQPCSTIEEIAT